MAEATKDRDLTSIQEARVLAHRAKQAQVKLAELSQERVDTIIDAMASTAAHHAEDSAKAAVDETGYGVVADKLQKNLFAAVRIHNFIRPLRTVGIIRRLEKQKIIEIASKTSQIILKPS